MAIEEPAFMKDLHKIREEMYNEMKGLRWKEKIQRIRREAQNFLRENKHISLNQRRKGHCITNARREGG